MSVYTVRVPVDVWPSRRDWRGVVAGVNVAPGDRVRAGDVVVEVEVEKAVLEIETPVSGVVAVVHVAPGDEVGPGDPLVDVEVQEG